jgi:hypothetical protein
MFGYDLSMKSFFWSDENKKLLWKSIDEFKKPNYFCKKENLYELRKNFCEALFHIPYHIERYENLLRGDGQTNKQYFLALATVEYFASEIKKKFISFFPKGFVD